MVRKIENNNKKNINDTKNKNQMDDNPEKPKKRGRKPKKIVEVENEPKIPKKRGRKPKKILTDVIIDKTVSSKDNSKPAVILRLNIDPSKINMNNLKKQVEEISEKSLSSEDMFNTDIPNESNCYKCTQYEKRISTLEAELNKLKKKNRLNKSNHVHVNKINFISVSSGNKIKLRKTKQKCLWDSNTFDNLPCFLPENYYDNTYYVSGCFCSFNCALAHNLYYIKDSKVYHRKSLVYKLYKEMFGIPIDSPIEIKEAPPRELLEDFGGPMSIEKFRKSFSLIDKEYIVYMPPIRPIDIYIEERNLDQQTNHDDNGYVLKRKKPGIKKEIKNFFNEKS
jgi:hypothetical protein